MRELPLGSHLLAAASSRRPRAGVATLATQLSPPTRSSPSGPPINKTLITDRNPRLSPTDTTNSMKAGLAINGSATDDPEPVEDEVKDQGVKDALERKQRVMRDRMKVKFSVKPRLH
jgi:hypothetical protein